uniref:Putative secreted protein n=1 Tax=Panstrongylus lignarius TaxID=156445 RepID=A0A224XY84_9HEMI
MTIIRSTILLFLLDTSVAVWPADFRGPHSTVPLQGSARTVMFSHDLADTSNAQSSLQTVPSDFTPPYK